MKTTAELFGENLRSQLYAQNKTQADLSKQEPVKENIFTKNWKDVYQMLDDSHKRSFWRNLIKGVRLDENMKPVEIMY